tara:strand:- start:2483 stop:2929 length:447 start_codon:yes stop_codon:yes gene_type:complete
MKSILLLMGPNLNMLGEREPEIYGSATMQDHIEDAERVANEFGYELLHFQSNNEGDLVNQIHNARGKHTGIIINPGALTHYGWSIHDALLVYEGIIIEMHLSNPNQRESWRHTSVVAPVADGSIIGFGIQGYGLSIRALHQIIENDDK